jgi:hypothetical protein
MKRSALRRLTLLLALALPAAAFAGPRALDEGMWPLNKVPRETLKKKYGVELTDAWLERVQKSAVRMGSGGSGSLVSPNGLVMTNHHVGSDAIEKLSTPERNLLEDGFYARTNAEEIACKDLECDVLWSIEDVTDRVNAAAKPEMSSADANTARRAMISTIEKESKDKTGLKSEVVTLYQGGRYHLYCYKSYQDVRLVMAPEKAIAFFGGDPDNFEYPRYDLDISFFRIYENGKPLQNEHYLPWSRSGTAENDLVFVAGHPGRTQRLYTVAHLEFLRDVAYPLTMRSLWRREVQLANFRDRNAENARIAEGDHFSVQNSRKAYTGMLEGLQDPRMMAEKLAAENRLRQAVAANPAHQEKWGSAWDEIAKAEATYASFYQRYAAPGIGRGPLGSLYGIARHLVRLADEKPLENSKRLREYADSNWESLEQQLFSEAPLYAGFETEQLASGLQLMVELLGGKDPAVVTALGGLSTRARAEQLVQGTKLMDVAERKRLYEGGKAAIDASKDGLVLLAKALDAENRKQRKQYEDQVESVERAAYSKIAAAQFAIFGEELYPDATFTLRLTWGTVKGYEQDGQRIEPFTDFEGLYDHSAERGNVPPFQLPERWVEKKSALALDTPYDFVSTCDIIGGNSGSPVIDKKGEVVGIIFDGNIQSLIFNFAYEEEQARAVATDSRGILEALNKVYECRELVGEILGEPGS